MKALLLAVALTCGCAPPQVRFSDRHILWRDPDDDPIPMPKERELLVNWMALRDAILLPADRVLGLQYGNIEATNVNALDEVPDSSWFEDPRRDRTARNDRVQTGPLAGRIENGAWDGVDPQPPFTVIQGKQGGSAAGFVVRDARGTKWLFKLDPRRYPSLVTSTEVVASRLAWGAGWRVPAETLIEFQRSDLVLAPDATRLDRFNDKQPFDQAELDQRLALAERNPDGSWRACASAWLPGRYVGQFNYFGQVKDDPNDRVRHEDRRDLRAFGVWASWVNNVDALEGNTLDMYVGKPGFGHVVHYQQDVGGAFGNFAAGPMAPWMGLETAFAPSQIALSFATLGILPRRWDRTELRQAPKAAVRDWPELGFFDVEHFDPHDWHALLDNPAFWRQTARDRYWGAKRVAGFTEDDVRLAVRAGRYRRPEVSERLASVLLGRRTRIARAFFADVAPLDHFRLDPGRLCFDDLWIATGLGGDAATLYFAVEDDGARLPVHDRCVTLAPRPGYRVVELRVRRPADRRPGPPVRVHLREWRILGIER